MKCGRSNFHKYILNSGTHTLKFKEGIFYNLLYGEHPRYFILSWVDIYFNYPDFRQRNIVGEIIGLQIIARLLQSIFGVHRDEEIY